MAEYVFLADLTVLKSDGDIDVILGIDWLTKHKGLMSCSPRSVSLVHPRGFRVQIDTTHWLDDAEKAELHALTEKIVQDVPVVCEYPDIFLDELLGMPPDRDIEFVIDLVPRIGPIAKRPYRMAADELAELKKQLQELMDKGFIRPSASP
jgi:hypothetical protein